MGKTTTDQRLQQALASIIPGPTMRYYHAHLRGISPLLMHKPDAESIGSNEAKKKKPTPAEEAATTRYLNTDGTQLVLPAIALNRSLVGVAGGYKMKLASGRAQSLTAMVAGALFIQPDDIPLGHAADDYEVDARVVVIKAAGAARIIRGRAKLRTWDCHPILSYDTRDFGEDDNVSRALQQMLEEAGRRVGLLDFRPQKKGPFGRFEVVTFEEVHPEGN